jgi:MFS transporter, PAT family, beta-lactamase induction signal transducer AmpG
VPAFLCNRRIGVMLPLGFASGLPLALTAGTLQAWLSSEHIDLETIGWLTLVGLPYNLKFLWAPVMDRFVPPWLGRRRGWMLVTQISLMLAVSIMAMTGPQENLRLLAALALLTAFLSASQDIVFDAYRTDLLHPEERGIGAAVWVWGYRIALMIASSYALMLAARLGWSAAYGIMVGFMAVGLLTIMFCEEPPAAAAPASFAAAVRDPLREFLSRPEALALVGLLILYKLGDALAASLTTPFLINGVGFTLEEVGVAKIIAVGATLIGAAAGAVALTRWGLFRSLMVCGFLQAVSNLGFLALDWAGRDATVLAAVVVLENLAGGMGTAAFVTLVMSLCDHRYTATQFALLTSLEALNRVLLGGPAARLVGWGGWSPFFLITILAAVPGLWLLWRTRRTLLRLNSAA